MENQNEPKLEEYGLDASSYENCRIQKIELEKSFDDYEKKLMEELSSSIKNIETDSGYKFASFFSFSGESSWLFIFPMIPLLILLIRDGVFLPLVIVIICFLFYKKISNIYNSTLNKISSERNSVNHLIDVRKKELREKIQALENKIHPFEQASVDFYINYLKQFFENYLYKKRSGGEKFEQSLSEFSLMIAEVEEIYNKLIFTKLSLFSALRNHKSYLEGRKINHELQKNQKVFNSFNNIRSQKEIEEKIQEVKPEITIVPNIEIPIHEHDYLNQTIKSRENINNKNEEIIEIKENKKKGFWASIMEDVNKEIDKSNNPTSGINKTEEKENIIDLNPPETKYRTPRKIDWNSVNQTKKITGLKGEEIVLEMEKSYLNSIGMKELSGKVRHVSKEVGDGLGYDILSYFADGQEKYIEVKSSNRANNNSFYISQNELDFMKNNKNNYVIYRIFNINENEEMPTLRVHRADDILGYKQIIPSQYIVKMD